MHYNSLGSVVYEILHKNRLNAFSKVLQPSHTKQLSLTCFSKGPQKAVPMPVRTFTPAEVEAAVAKRSHVEDPSSTVQPLANKNDSDFKTPRNNRKGNVFIFPPSKLYILILK